MGRTIISFTSTSGAQLLASGVKPSDIAPQIGMYDQSQLNRHFRRIVGTTPR